jgi:hypothetical protein
VVGRRFAGGWRVTTITRAGSARAVAGDRERGLRFPFDEHGDETWQAARTTTASPVQSPRRSARTARRRTPAPAPPAAAAAGGGAAAAGVDPKKLFCDNWDTVKAVLGFLRSVAPAFLKPIIDMVIRAGDAVKATICR